MTISALLGDAGEKMAVTHGEKTYRAGPITQKVKSAWERRLMSEALALLHESVKGLPPEAAGVAASDFAGRRAEYAFYGRRSMAALQTFDGQTFLASLLFDVSHEEAEALVLARPAAVLAVLEAVMQESFGAVIAFGEMQRAKAGAEGGEGKGRT